MTLKIKTEGLFFTSDTHLFHKGLISHGLRREFTTVDEINAKLITSWNTAVPRDGTVFHLGDVSFGSPHDTLGILGQLNGRIHLIRGNHDRKMRSAVAAFFNSVHDYLEIDAVRQDGTKQRIVLMHFALRTWNRHHYGSWHLHGHSHGSLDRLGRSMDVGVDTRSDLAPWSFSEIEAILSNAKTHINDHHEHRTDSGPVE